MIVYCKIAIPMLDELPNFWKKLKLFIGDFKIEPHPIDQWITHNEIIISFYTDRFEFMEGEPRRVELIAKRNIDDWDFTEIKKI